MHSLTTTLQLRCRVPQCGVTVSESPAKLGVKMAEAYKAFYQK